MCDVLIPALIGIGALALLGGGVSSNCGPCAAPAQGSNIVIPQQSGIVTNGIPTSSAPAEFYSQAPAPSYAAAAPYQTAAPVGAYADPYGVGAQAGPVGASIGTSGVGAQVGPVDLSVGSPRAY